MTMSVRVLLAAVCGLALTGCQIEPVPDAPAGAEKPQGYVALPGQAATSQTPSATDAAFEAAAAALRAGSPRPQEPQAEAAPAEPPPVNADPPAVQQAVAAAAAESAEKPAAVSATPTAPPVEAPQPTGDAAGYALQITNGTLGRLYIEVQDDGGNIFPFGFMYSHQRLCSQPQEPKPIQGQLTIVIRDPDSPGAPEVRRYQVTPPPNYMGKTLSVTLLPGRYRAAVDGEVYYTSPPPPEPAQE